MEDNLDEQLQQIFKILPLQLECIAYRTATPEYRKLLKSTCVAELKNLVNVEVIVEEAQLKMPDVDQLPPRTLELPKSRADALLRECSIFEEGCKLLG